MNPLVKMIFSKKVVLLYALVSVMEVFLILCSRESFFAIEKDLNHLFSSHNLNVEVSKFFSKNLWNILKLLTTAYLFSMLYWTSFSFLKSYVYYLYENNVNAFKNNVGQIIWYIFKFYGFWNTIMYLFMIIQTLLVTYAMITLNPLLLLAALLVSLIAEALNVWVFMLKLNSSVMIGVEKLGAFDLQKIENFTSRRLVLADLGYFIVFFILEGYEINLLITYVIILLINLLIAYLLVNEYINYRKRAAQSS
jgi:hypothetical protein